MRLLLIIPQLFFIVLTAFHISENINRSNDTPVGIDREIITNNDSINISKTLKEVKKVEVTIDKRKLALIPVSNLGLASGDAVRIDNIENTYRRIQFRDAEGKVIYKSKRIKRRKSLYTIIPQEAVYIDDLKEGKSNISISVVNDYPAISSFVTEDIKHGVLGAKLSIPNPKTNKIIKVSNAVELSSAIDRFNNGESLTIKLLSDIGLKSGLNINNNNKTLIIEGNGHSVFPTGGILYQPQGYKGKFAFCELKGQDVESLVTEDGTLVRLGRSKVFEALGPVLNEDGSVSDNSVGVKKVKIPNDLQLQFKENDKIWIYYTVGFEKKSSLITKLKNGYLYFTHTSNAFNPNSDYNKFGKYIAFQIINYNDGKGYYIRDNVIYFPSKYRRLYNPIFPGGLFNIDNTAGTIVFNNILFKSRGPYQYNVINTVNTGEIVLKNCKIIDVYNGIYDKATIAGGAFYVDHCYFENVYCFGIYPGLNSSYITYNKCYNVGECGSYYGQCLRAGHGVSYIGYNELVNYGYCGIIASNTTCVVEHNILMYTPDYFKYAEVFQAEDSGAIYTGQKNKNLIIRYNTIINYTGRFHNSGVYLDDGANNAKVIGNRIENVPNYYAIYARDDGRTEDRRNTGRLIAYNIMDNGIMLRGSKSMSQNDTYLGYNIICKNAQTILSHVGYLSGEEKQFYTTDVSLKNGEVVSEQDYSEWLY